MNTDLLAFLGFAVAASATPGPNNIMALATAARHGLRATVPLILGVAAGFGFMLTVIGTGLAQPLASHAGLHTALRWAGAAWMLVLAWQIARAGSPAAPKAPRAGAPLGFWGACAFQWVNPKAWILAVATTATYTLPGESLTPQVLVLAGLFMLVTLPSLGAWALLGAGSGQLLASPRRMRAFNLAMGLLLAASVIPAVLE
ncbi:LysE family translocator [Roseomonas sp. E05]|uniref:LysE family translocator n=1 Tax=Roseomonas sp. E05 TaxID=3046310 RepID=UPI0024BA3B1C|nr:LysE family translocator [Roseomonas sp. E05]MDJ0387377.1 LysE family translocator [Roseomonas sp. E05]